MAWAHGIPMIYVAKGGIPLLAAAHATKLGNISLKTDKNLKDSSAFFSIGAVIASASFVRMPRSKTRQQLATQQPPTYPNEERLQTYRDKLAEDHNGLSILLGDIDENTESQLIQLPHILGYRLQCADRATNSKVHTISKKTWNKLDIATTTYDKVKSLPYENQRTPNDHVKDHNV